MLPNSILYITLNSHVVEIHDRTYSSDCCSPKRGRKSEANAESCEIVWSLGRRVSFPIASEASTLHPQPWKNQENIARKRKNRQSHSRG